MSFKLADLPYQYSALEPYIDTQTLQVHHTKHHATYVNNLNAAISAGQLHPATPSPDLVTIQQTAHQQPAAIRNNGGGHYGHSLYWNSMAPVGSSNPRPSGKLAEGIDKAFGSWEGMRERFTEAAVTRFGSGYAWLGVVVEEGGSGKLVITSTANQDNPLMKGVVEYPHIPIMCLDVWEHAYYLKYQNRRKEYIEQWWNLVNWDSISQSYDNYLNKGIIPL